jgi:2-desacetyl-2-hydroxyethyl bacteriochlorophyllide A dehydrogenase
MDTVPQARIHGVNELRLDRLPRPDCGDDDVVVSVRECGICGSDLGYLAMGGLLGPGNPMPLGHELWGEVARVGANVRHVAPGDRVVVQPLTSDNHIGNGGPEGGFTPELLVRNAATAPGSVIRLPDDLPAAWGALVEPLAVARHGANRAGVSAADRAVIHGAGPIGLSLLEVLKFEGLQDIAVVDLSASRLDTAAAMGAVALRGDDEQLGDKLRELHGASEFFGMPAPATSVYFEATGVRQVFEGIVAAAGPRSRICLMGVHKEPASVDLVMLLAKEVSIVPAMGYDNEFDEVIAMLQSGRVDPSAMITHHFPLSNVVDAFELARNPDSAIKIIVDCQS